MHHDRPQRPRWPKRRPANSAPRPSAAATPGRRGARASSWSKWNQAIAPSVAARRRCLQLLGDKQAVRVLFAEVAPRFADRPGGYTRILRLAKPRLGDAGTRAILEFVGVRDRVVERSVRPDLRRRSAAAGEVGKKKPAAGASNASEQGAWGRAAASSQLRQLCCVTPCTSQLALTAAAILLPYAARSKRTGTHSSGRSIAACGRWPGCRASMRTAIHFGAALALLVVPGGGCRLFPEQAAVVQGHSPLQPAQPSPDSVAMEIIWARFPAERSGAQRRGLARDRRNADRARRPARAGQQRLSRRRHCRLTAARCDRAACCTKAKRRRTTHKRRRRPSRKPPTSSPSRSSTAAVPQLRRNQRTEIQASEVYPSMPLLVSGGARAGRPHVPARLRPSTRCAIDPQPDRTATVELTPELHYGAPQLRWTGGDDGMLAPGAAARPRGVRPMRMSVKLAPGEMLVLMSLPDAGSRLGHYFHTVDSADGPQQKLILIRLAEVPPSDTFADTANC